METAEDLVRRLRGLCAPKARDQIIAKGMARGMIWQSGELPPDSPRYPVLLTNDLLDHGYSILGCALRLQSFGDVQAPPITAVLDIAYRTAAESIEAAIRRGEPRVDRGFHLTIAAAAFHLGHYAARSFSLLAEEERSLNLASCERLLVALMRRNFDLLSDLCREWLMLPENNDDGVAALLESSETQFDASDAAYTAINRVLHRAVAHFDFAIRTGFEGHLRQSIKLLDQSVEASADLAHVPLWWVSVLTRHLIEDLWGRSMHQMLPVAPPDGDRWNELRQNFIDLLRRRDVAEIDLWPSQLEAASRIVDESDSLVVALPTSSGKTRIAELCILKCLASSRRVIYVTPLRALSAQVELTLSRTFRPLGFTVSSVYGASGLGASDVDTMRLTSIVVATPEKLDFAIRQDPTVIDDVGLIVLDEGHMIGLNEREIRYEVLVQRLLRRSDANARRIVCLSAIFTKGQPFDAFTSWIRSDREGDAIRSDWRPTRQRPATLEWRDNVGYLEYRVLGETVFVPRFLEPEPPVGRRRLVFPKDRQELIAAIAQKFHNDAHSILIYCPTRRSVEPTAHSFITLVRQGYLESFIEPNAASEIATAIRIGEEWLGPNHVAIHALKLGIAVHHGQMPRPFLAEIEILLRRKILTIVISSPTLAQGVDLSFSVLIFTSLWRNQSILEPKEFANVVGRVGRAFVDLDGIYILPVFDTSRRKRQQRLSEFHTLVKQAQGRQLESGLFLLISVCLSRIKSRFSLSDSVLEEYVLNQQATIDSFAAGEDEAAEQMQIILAELDAGIFALVEDLDCDGDTVAIKVDEALQSSLWRRRLEVKSLEVQRLQLLLLQSRSRHIWGRTTQTQRKGFFSASIGTESGLQIVEQRIELQELMNKAVDAIENGQSTKLGEHCCELADRLFAIYPFQPDMPTDWDKLKWTSVLKAWIAGAPVHEVTDSAGIAFVQDGLVFRLVWALEATRIVLSATDDQPREVDLRDTREFVALCMTYGVPTVAAARLLERGLESRVLATRLTRELGLTFTTQDEVSFWLISLNGSEPLQLNDSEKAVWQRFVQATPFNNRVWARQTIPGRIRDITEDPPQIGTDIRVIPRNGTNEVYTADFQLIGTCDCDLPKNSDYTGRVDGDWSLSLGYFGPVEPPKWLQDLFDDV